jgi:predicted small secreted protein
MTKNKSKEFFKALGIAALAIGLFSAAFVGINTLAFAASTSAVESLYPAAASVVIPTEQAPANDFVEPTLTVSLVQNQSTPSANALSPDEAALIAAEYIWQMFGESIDGKYVLIWYSAHPSHTRAYWMGSVAEQTQETMTRDATLTERARLQQARNFTFTIDAVTGEWIDIGRGIGAGVMSDDVRNALYELSNDRTRVDEFYNLRRGGSAPEQLDEHADIALEHAARHFAGTEVVSVEFNNFGVSQFDLDENGNLFAAVRMLMFEVTDNTGRVAQVLIDETTGELLNINTLHNDIVPGFRFAAYERSGD